MCRPGLPSLGLELHSQVIHVQQGSARPPHLACSYAPQGESCFPPRRGEGPKGLGCQNRLPSSLWLFFLEGWVTQALATGSEGRGPPGLGEILKP